MKWREVGPYLTELWQRPAGPMNWKNPIRVFAVPGWLVVQGFVLLGLAGWRVFQGLMLLGWTVFRVVQFVLALPALLLFFFAGLWYAVWSFVRRPFPSLDENPLLALVNYHTPNFFDWLVLWYYVSPFVAVMLSGLITITVWKVWLEGRRRDFAPFAKLPPWPLDPGARTVYRRGDLRSRGIGENLGLHEPVCPPASRLASGQSAASGGGIRKHVPQAPESHLVERTLLLEQIQHAPHLVPIARRQVEPRQRRLHSATFRTSVIDLTAWHAGRILQGY